MFAFLSRKRPPKLLERLETLESAQNVLDLEMEELKHLYRRLLGRQKWDMKEPEKEDHREAVGEADPGATVTSSHRFLTPRQHQLQQEILRRRAGG
jgi:hypothetical protein